MDESASAISHSVSAHADASTCRGESPSQGTTSSPPSEPESTPLDDPRFTATPWADAAPVWPAPAPNGETSAEALSTGGTVVLAHPAPVNASAVDDDDDAADEPKPGSDAPKSSIRKQAWTADEDAKLHELVTRHGPSNWSRIAADLPSRIGKQCRERWCNHLSPAVKKEVRSPHAIQPPNFRALFARLLPSRISCTLPSVCLCPRLSPPFLPRIPAPRAFPRRRTTTSCAPSPSTAPSGH